MGGVGSLNKISCSTLLKEKLIGEGYSDFIQDGVVDFYDLLTCIKKDSFQADNYFLKKPSMFNALDLSYYKHFSLAELYSLGFITKKLKFRCPSCGYQYIFTPSEIIWKKSLYGCACCSGRVVVAGVNDLRSNDNHNILLDWDYSKNRFTPESVSAYSSKLVNWKCHKCGYCWKKDVSSRNSKRDPRGCPVCTNQKIISGVNDFATVNKKYMFLWDYAKNELNPTKISPSNSKKVHLRCPKGHSFTVKCNNLTTKLKVGHIPCPYCSGKRVVSGVNDAATLYPYILEKWDYNKNKLKPTEVLPFSDNIIWWKCSKGHSWNTSIGYMCRENTGCPICWQECGTSNIEREIKEYIKEIYQGKVEENKKLYNNFFSKESDIVLPDKKLAIEVNGVYYHSTAIRSDPLYHKKKLEDVKKFLSCNLYFVWEDDWLYANTQSKVLLNDLVKGTMQFFPYFREVSYSVALRLSRQKVGVLPKNCKYYLAKNKGDSLLLAESDGIILYSSNPFRMLNSLSYLPDSIFAFTLSVGLSHLLENITNLSLIKGDVVDKFSVIDNKRVDGEYSSVSCYSEEINIWRFR